jgi:hypothetical protein
MSLSRTAGDQIDTRIRKILQSGMSLVATQAVEAVYRSDWGRIVAALIGLVGDFDLAEESAQEAFTAAVDQWRTSGIRSFRGHGSSQRLGTRPLTASGARRGSKKSLIGMPLPAWSKPSKNRITTAAKFPTIAFA